MKLLYSNKHQEHTQTQTHQVTHSWSSEVNCSCLEDRMLSYTLVFSLLPHFSLHFLCLTPSVTLSLSSRVFPSLSFLPVTPPSLPVLLATDALLKSSIISDVLSMCAQNHTHPHAHMSTGSFYDKQWSDSNDKDNIEAHMMKCK